MSLFPTRRDFRGFGDLGRRFFDDGFVDSFFSSTNPIRTDIRETDDAFILEAELPGFTKENIHIEYEDNVLTISAQQEMTTEEEDLKNGRYIRRERSSSSYSRQFLIQNVRKEDIKATFKDGLLEVVLPKLTPSEPTAHRIEIE